jgi:hypothetical protein
MPVYYRSVQHIKTVKLLSRPNTKHYAVATYYFYRWHTEMVVHKFYVARIVGFGYDISHRALTPYSGDLNHCRRCVPASEDGLKENPKHVRQK